MQEFDLVPAHAVRADVIAIEILNQAWKLEILDLEFKA